MDLNAYHKAWLTGAPEAECVRAGEDACFEKHAHDAQERAAHEAMEREEHVAEERAAISEAEEARREQEFEQLGEWLQAHMEERGLEAEDVKRMIEDAEEIKALFDLQHKRSKAAQAAWRRDTGCKEFVNPDLGALLEHFLMLRRELIQLRELLRIGVYASDEYADAMERLDKIFG